MAKDGLKFAHYFFHDDPENTYEGTGLPKVKTLLCLPGSLPQRSKIKGIFAWHEKG